MAANRASVAATCGSVIACANSRPVSVRPATPPRESACSCSSPAPSPSRTLSRPNAPAAQRVISPGPHARNSAAPISRAAAMSQSPTFPFLSFVPAKSYFSSTQTPWVT